MSVSYGSDKITFDDGSSLSTGYTHFRNRIINGDMRIDQRNAGASTTPGTGTNVFPIDRFYIGASQNSKLTTQQNAGAITPPVGFSNYLGITSSSAYSVVSSDYFFLEQTIEGFNTADLEWGTANAKTVTLSFQVYSSLTGTFGGSIRNSAISRSYPFSYTVSSANTWTTINITIPGDTSGTWIGATNGIGLRVAFSLGMGSTFSGTAGAWSGNNFGSATGATSVVGTNNATFFITGVQLEVGSYATTFERRPYGTELQLCQRYYYRATASTVTDMYGNAFAYNTQIAMGLIPFPVTMRVAPSALEQSGTASDYRVLITGGNVNCNAVPSYDQATRWNGFVYFNVASGLTAGHGCMLRSGTSAAGYLGWSAEL